MEDLLERLEADCSADLDDIESRINELEVYLDRCDQLKDRLDTIETRVNELS